PPSRSRAAASTARTSLTPALVADSSSKAELVAWATIWARVVLPLPAGPHRITERSSSASIRERRALRWPSTWAWPTNSSRVRGRIRAASGAPACSASSAPAENRSVGPSLARPGCSLQPGLDGGAIVPNSPVPSPGRDGGPVGPTGLRPAWTAARPGRGSRGKARGSAPRCRALVNVCTCSQKAGGVRPDRFRYPVAQVPAAIVRPVPYVEVLAQTKSQVTYNVGRCRSPYPTPDRRLPAR